MPCRLYRSAGRCALALLIADVTATLSPPATGAQRAASTPSAVSSYVAYVAEAAGRFDVSEDLIWAVMRAESGGNPRAVSPAGAMGLMQLMPATWATLTARYQLGADPFDIRANIIAGAAYLRGMFDRYGDLGIALAAYNAGPRRVDDWRAGTRPLPAETIAYVARIAPAPDALGMSSSAPRTALLPDWRSATVFAIRDDGPSARTAAAPDVRPERAATASPSVLSAPTPFRTNPLFIPLTGQSAQ